MSVSHGRVEVVGDGPTVATAEQHDEHQALADQRFIAAARADVPALCDRVEALEAAINKALKWIPRDSRGAADLRAALDGGE